jgi:hypothetical protein
MAPGSPAGSRDGGLADRRGDLGGTSLCFPYSAEASRPWRRSRVDRLHLRFQLLAELADVAPGSYAPRLPRRAMVARRRSSDGGGGSSLVHSLPPPSTVGIGDPMAAARRRCSFPPPSLPPRVVGLARGSPGPAPRPRVACVRYDAGFGVGARRTGCPVCFRVPRCG